MDRQDQDVVEATSQLSRFHVDCVDPTSKNVDLHQVTLTIACHDYLVDAHLQLMHGTHYGMIGRNGVGKSSLMRMIGEKRLIGFPHNITALYVKQEIIGDDRDVLQTVLEADAEKTDLENDVERLESALSQPDMLASVVQSVLAKRADKEAEFAGRISDKRSGFRGQIAREEYISRKERAEQAHKADISADVAADMAPQLLADMYEKLAEMDTDSDEPRAVAILNGLGFTPEQQKAPTRALSGGWRMRAALAVALFSRPALLLLDEPTNHLDMRAALWLQEHLRRQRGEQTLVVVSHDRDFLNAVAEELIIFRDNQLTYFPGNYDAYVAARDEKQASKIKQVEKLDKQRKKVEGVIAEATRTAKKTGDDKKLGLAASRRKKLERLGAEKLEDGKRFKLSYHMPPGLHKRPAVQLDSPEAKCPLVLPEPGTLRYHGPVLQLKEVAFRYRGAATDLLSGVTMDIEPGSRVALLGRNGAGKSTLLGLIAGTLTPTRGIVERHHNLKIGFFRQHCMDSLDLEASGAEQLKRAQPDIREDQDAFDFLGSFGLPAPLARQRSALLSGGQKARLALALVMATRPQVLLLDEPTNHLDLQAVEALEEAVVAFAGAVVLVSHDTRFVSATCPRCLLVAKGGVSEYPGGATAYAAKALNQVRKQHFPGGANP